MNTYISEKVMSYVYVCTHKETGEFYIGYRSANKVPADKDLGYKYFTSSKTIKYRFHEFKTIILAEFFKPEYAYEFEQYMIRLNWESNLILNKAVYNHNNIELKCYKRGPTKKACAVDAKTGINLGMVLLEDNRWKTGEIIHFNKGKKKPAGFSDKLRNANLGKRLSKETIEKIRNSCTGIKQSDITINKRIHTLRMSERIWINNSIHNKRILLEEFNNYKLLDWKLGRIGKTNQYD